VMAHAVGRAAPRRHQARRSPGKVAVTSSFPEVMTAARASCAATTTMSASEATFTPSRNALAVGEARRRGTSGPLSATKTKAGRKMPAVVTMAPAGPARM
jgi:hypothetical protein